MFSWRLIPLTLASILFAVPLARAQEGTVRVATCNPAKVFEGMDERKAVQDKMNIEREKIKVEVQRRKAEVDQIRLQRDELNPKSQQWKEKSRLLMEKAVDFEVWAKLTEQEVARAEKEQVQTLYERIREGVKEVAEAKKIDLVQAERRPDLTAAGVEQLTPDQFRNLISQIDVLYANEKADITQAVIVAVNKKYATGGTAPAPPK
jgi:Skp family chaperone for outer membrane proteins